MTTLRLVVVILIVFVLVIVIAVLILLLLNDVAYQVSVHGLTHVRLLMVV